MPTYRTELIDISSNGMIGNGMGIHMRTCVPGITTMEPEGENEMMNGKFVELNWRDVIRILKEYAGAKTEPDQRAKAEVWLVGDLTPPKHDTDTCIRIQVYDKPFSERIKEHAGEQS